MHPPLHEVAHHKAREQDRPLRPLPQGVARLEVEAGEGTDTVVEESDDDLRRGIVDEEGEEKKLKNM
ncbi:MAG: hypothetical protein OHK0039_23890 [Bacteroidia bacterium]